MLYSWAANPFVGLETQLTNFENLKSISNIFQETHNFLVLTDPINICIYLRTTDRHLRDQGNVRHPTSKILKCDFDDFCCRESIPCFLFVSSNMVILKFAFSSFHTNIPIYFHYVFSYFSKTHERIETYFVHVSGLGYISDICLQMQKTSLFSNTGYTEVFTPNLHSSQRFLVDERLMYMQRASALELSSSKR